VQHQVLVEKSRNFRERLEKALSGSDETFLSIGMDVQKFSVVVKDLFNHSEKVAHLLAGDEIKNAITNLQQIFANLRRYLNQTEEKIQQGTQSLKKSLDIIHGIEDSLLGFKRIIKTLNMLSFSTKMENARQHRADPSFDALANDVQQLADLIGTNCKSIQTKSESLKSKIDEILSKMARDFDIRQKQAKNLLDKMEQNIAFLRERQEHSSAVSRQISDSLQEIMKKVNEIVMSVQFHDITRQKIERICSSLDTIQAKLTEGAAMPQKRNGELLSWGCNELQSQSSRLKDTEKELTRALGVLVESFRGISEDVSAMAKKTFELAGTAGESESSFLDAMENNIVSVVSSLTENAQLGQRIFETMLSIARSVSEMSRFVKDIDEIGQEIEHIAINAQVKAAKTGHEGASLIVVAESIQKLSGDARKETNAVSERLTQISSIGNKLTAEGKSASNRVEKEMKQIRENIEQMVKVFQSTNNEVVHILSELGKKGQALTDDIQSTSNRVSNLNKIGESFNIVATEMDAFANC